MTPTPNQFRRCTYIEHYYPHWLLWHYQREPEGYQELVTPKTEGMRQVSNVSVFVLFFLGILGAYILNTSRSTPVQVKKATPQKTPVSRKKAVK